MERLVQRTATILIALGGRSRWYRSADELPQALRRKLEETTSGPNSATLLIADENGRQEILKQLAKTPPTLEAKLVQSMIRRKPGFRHWIEAGFVAGIGVCLYLLAAWK